MVAGQRTRGKHGICCRKYSFHSFFCLCPDLPLPPTGSSESGASGTWVTHVFALPYANRKPRARPWRSEDPRARPLRTTGARHDELRWSERKRKPRAERHGARIAAAIRQLLTPAPPPLVQRQSGTGCSIRSFRKASIGVSRSIDRLLL